MIQKLCVCVMIVGLWLPSSALSQTPQELRAGIGYAYQSVGDGKLGIEYALTIFHDEERIEDVAASLSRAAKVKDLIVDNSLRFSYDLLNRVSLTIAVPYVYRKVEFWESDTSGSNIGDVSAGFKVQLTEDKGAAPVLNFLAVWYFPTGQSPYEINPEKKVATGAGYRSVEMGLTFSQAMGKVMPFARLAYILTLQQESLDNMRYGDILAEYDPGDLFGGELGLTGSVEESVSVTASVEYFYQFGGHYVYRYSGKVPEADTIYAVATIGAGFTVGKVSVNPKFGFGITDDAPDFLFQIRIPFDMQVK